ncbi:MAG: hypothetical protein CM1200mP3_04950 [Chloroflexota bacterium]|nr:MAG: hypothetical protein CM1200mP3_04950 [Chloroflexota bacterium]
MWFDSEPISYHEFNKKFCLQGGLVLGICNGFQILCESGLLPGALIRNSHLNSAASGSILGLRMRTVFSLETVAKVKWLKFLYLTVKGIIMRIRENPLGKNRK